MPYVRPPSVPPFSHEPVKHKKNSALDALVLKIDHCLANAIIALEFLVKPLEPIVRIISNQTFCSYCNYSWQSPMPGDAAWKKIERKIVRRYGGQMPDVPIRRGLAYSVQFQKSTNFSEEDRPAVQTIVDHRRILAELCKKMRSSSIGASTTEIQKRLRALSDPKSRDVVHVKNKEKTYSSFTIPGGCIGHAVTYEFQRDESGVYYFVIHNRGLGVKHREMHGPIFQLAKGGQWYARTSVRIEVSEEQIKDRQFLKALLISKHMSGSMDMPYSIISRYLSTNGSLKIVQSEIERDFLRKRAELKRQNIQQNDFEMSYLVRQLILHDPAYHSLQSFGTCTESNLTGAEKAMASPKLRRQLKLFSINQLMLDVVRKRVFLPMTKMYKKKIQEHHQLRVQMLQTKIRVYN